MIRYRMIQWPGAGFLLMLALLVQELLLRWFATQPSSLAETAWRVAVTTLGTVSLALLLLPPRRLGYVLGALVCAGLIGYALYAQYVLGLEPCPLCVFQRIAVIANRVKNNTPVYKAQLTYLETLNIPVVATLRDSQNYSRGAESGLGLFEMKPNHVREDMEQWLPLIGWLAQRRPLHIAPGTPAITSAASVNSLPVTTTAAAAPVVSPVVTPVVSPVAGPIPAPDTSESDPATTPPAAPTIG